MSKALQMVGLPNIDGFNSGKLIGSSYCSSTISSKAQTRSTSTAYIKEAEDLDNLKVYTQTLAEKILFDSKKNAIGVELQSLGLPYTIHASKEVIVSAGAFQSPQLLMVSGIGPRDMLESLDIEVISERPGVGQNMWDHILFGPSYEMSIKTLSEVLKNPTVLASELLKYITKAEGVLTSPVVDFIGWEKIPTSFRKFSESTIEDLSQFPSDWPEVEIISGQGYIGNFTFPVVDQLLHGRLDQQFATILGALVAPTSRGNVTIKSKHTTDLPLVNPNWLTTKTDQEVAVTLYRHIRHIFQTAALQEVVIGEEFFPGVKADNDEEILSVIQNSLQTVWHAACTCSMGTSDNPLAVLNSDAKVYGVQGLRVVDASSFPLLPPGHPQSAVYMLAEKIADSILRA